ncbi:MAG: prolyl oligopeptidase family serine peptidase [Pseudoxanthomonas sp.]
MQLAPQREARASGLLALLLTLVLPVVHAEDLDSLQWLETPRDSKVLAWAQEHTTSSQAALHALPSYPAVRKELDGLLASGGTLPDVVPIGARALRLWKDATHPYGQLQVASRQQNGALGPWSVALDIATLRKREGVPYILQTYTLGTDCLAPEYRRCLLRLSPEGGDEIELREYDLDAKAFIAGGFSVPRGRTTATWLDRDHIFVGYTAGDAPRTSAGWPARISLWTRGQPLARAKPIYQAEPSDALVDLQTIGDGVARKALITRAMDYSHFQIFLADRDGGLEQSPFPTDLAPMGVQVATDNQVVVRLARPLKSDGVSYPAGALVAWAVDSKTNPRLSLVYAPREGEAIGDAIAGTHHAVTFVTSRQLRQQVVQVVDGAKGWSPRVLASPAPGEVAAVTPAHGRGDQVVIATTGFATPRRQELYDIDGAPVLLAIDPTLIPPDSYTTSIGTATSKDGTQIDYYLLKPAHSPWPGPQPLLVTGYAAFGNSYEPSYFGYTVGGLAFKSWMDRGGSLVIPAARGGGERGEAWHQAAMREHRQNSYDDFIAVIQHLVDIGYTRPDMIGVFGSSNGGLLAATLGTERPDLFGAVVSDVPLTDMLRMRYMGMGSAWLNEYGNPDDPVMRKVLLSYSPLHNIRQGIHYPPFLVTTATSDNRVGPGHARKLAARLEQVGAKVYFLEDQEGGHGVSDGFRNPDLMSMRITFFIDALMKK